MEATKTVKAGDMVKVRNSIGDQPASVMAVADGYAMLRYKGCVPFIARLMDLTPVEAANAR